VVGILVTTTRVEVKYGHRLLTRLVGIITHNVMSMSNIVGQLHGIGLGEKDTLTRGLITMVDIVGYLIGIVVILGIILGETGIDVKYDCL